MQYVFFFFNDTATTEIYPLSLHDALPICAADAEVDDLRSVHHCVADRCRLRRVGERAAVARLQDQQPCVAAVSGRSEEHTSELQSQSNLVCRLLLEKKKNTIIIAIFTHAL